MSNNKKDFYGKDVAEAIKDACDDLGVAQENLNIEVLETGSKGIFGLIRQKAHIRVSVQDIEEDPEDLQTDTQAEKKKARPKKKPVSADRKKPATEASHSDDAKKPEKDPEQQSDQKGSTDELSNNVTAGKEVAELSDESLTLIRNELQTILELMGCPSDITVEKEGGTAHCQVSADHQEVLTSQDGRVLDSLQYLLRKIISKKLASRVQLSIDVGDYREKRYEQLRELAVEYAAQVKEGGKTQVIASLNPSERRIVHVALQDDPDIRSRSVGDGLFKKVLIYKPGKGRKGGGRKRGRANARKKNNSGQKQEAS